MKSAALVWWHAVTIGSTPIPHVCEGRKSTQPGPLPGFKVVIPRPTAPPPCTPIPDEGLDRDRGLIRGGVRGKNQPTANADRPPPATRARISSPCGGYSVRLCWAGETEIRDKCGSAPLGISEALALERERVLGGFWPVTALVGIYQLRAVADMGSPCVLARED